MKAMILVDIPENKNIENLLTPFSSKVTLDYGDEVLYLDGQIISSKKECLCSTDKNQLLQKENIEIRDLRILTGLTQKEFSEKYKIPYQTLKKWEMNATEKVGEKEVKRKAPEYLINALKHLILYTE